MSIAGVVVSRVRASASASTARPGRGIVVVTAAFALLASVSSPASATTDDVTGDITKPEIVALELRPAAVDVTDAPAAVVVTARFTDEGTGVIGGWLGWRTPGQENHSYASAFRLVSGSASDGIYEARAEIPQGGASGRWALDVQARDRVGNVQYKGAAELERAGLPGYLDVASAHPDVTPPDVVELQVVPAEADVRGGPSSVTVRVRLVDGAAGVGSVYIPPTGPYGHNGGAHVPHMSLVSGTRSDGWWEGELRVDRYAHAGSWTFAVRPSDVLHNTQELSADDLAARGLSPRFRVLSHEDRQEPAFVRASLSSIAVDVSDSDQKMTFEAAVTDDRSGIQDYPWGMSNVQLSLQHPIGQIVGRAGMPRTSGTALNGTYGATFTIPRHSATGLWPLYLSATDAIGNAHSVGPVRLAELGLPPAVLIYNTPLPPLDVDVDPGDAAALVRWSPPSDDRGADVTEYVVRESPQGRVVRVDGGSRAVVVPDLDNGVQHQFVVHAINRAGESEPSATVAAVPADGLAVPEPDSGPEPEPELSPSPTPAPSAAPAPEPSTVPAPVEVTVTRLAGEDRVSTAIAISQAGFADRTAGAVVLSRSDDYADALAGTPLAATLDAPQLITPSTHLDARALTEIRRVLPSGGTVHLLGGEKALSPSVAAGLSEAGFVVRRIAGGDRYATAVRVAQRTSPSPKAILLATGRSFADALSAGAAAAAAGGVVVLTDDHRLPAATADYLAAQPVPTFAIGGPAAAAAARATAIVGANRYQTAVLTARRFSGRSGGVAIATGERFPDALAGGAHAAKVGAPLLLTPSAHLADVVARHLSESSARTAYAYGGRTAVDERVLTHVAQLLSD